MSEIPTKRQMIQDLAKNANALYVEIEQSKKLLTGYHMDQLSIEQKKSLSKLCQLIDVYFAVCCVLNHFNKELEHYEREIGSITNTWDFHKDKSRKNPKFPLYSAYKEMEQRRSKVA